MSKESQGGRSTGSSWRPVILFFGANMLFGAGLFAHAFLYNFYLDRLGLGAAVMGAAAAALTAGGLVALLPAGAIVDRLGARRAYLIAGLLSLAGQVTGAFLTTPIPIYAAAFVGGAGVSTWRVAAGPILMRLASGAMRSRVFSWNVALLLASGAVWIAVSGQVPGWIESRFGLGGVAGIRWALVLGAGGTLLGTALFLLVGRGLGSWDGDPQQHVEKASARAAIVGALRIPRQLMILAGLVALWMTAGGLVIQFFNLYFLRVHELDVGQIALVLAASQAFAAFLLLGSGEMAARFGTRRILEIWMLIFGPLLFGLSGVHGLGLAIVVFLVLGLVPPATNPLIDQLLLERAPANRQGAVSSWRNGATDFSGFVGAALGGYLLETTSFPVLFRVAGGLALVGAFALLLGLRRTRQPASD